MASPRGNPKSSANLTPVGLANSPLGVPSDPRRLSTQTSPRPSAAPVTASPLSRSGLGDSRLAMSGMDAAENMDKSTEVYSSDTTIIDNFNKQKSIFAVDGVPQNEEGLKTLMSKGAWKSVIQLAERCIAQAKQPHLKLHFRLCRLIAMTKLRMYQVAFNDFTDIGNFDDAKYRYDTYPDIYGNKRGSLVPFSLRILHAELPCYLGKDPNMDNLNALLVWVQTKLKELQSKSDAASSDSEDDSVAVWSAREDRIIMVIVNHFLRDKDFILAIKLYNKVLNKKPKDVNLLSGLGRIFLQMGNVRAAEVVFNQVEQLTQSTDSSTLVHINRGFLALSKDKVDEASKYFEKVLQIEPSNVLAISNKAICQMYGLNVSKAIQQLEDVVFSSANPDKTPLHETVIFNLCSLYDIQWSDKGIEKKRNVLNFVLQHATDNFDLTCLRIPTGAL
jgi:tetratricopeptide (TPR) repeat protein